VGYFLVAVVAGYEIQVKLGLIAAPGITSRGGRTTGILGAVAASAAASSAFGLSASQTVSSLGMGANMASGFLEWFGHGTMEPYIHGGLAASNGVLAGLMGFGGVHAASATFEGRTGYLSVFADLAPAEHSLPEEWMTQRVIAKPYPISGGKASTVDGALALLDQGLKVEEIDRVLVRLPMRIAKFPGSDNKGPFTSMHEVQDSSQFVIAATLLGRPMKDLKTVRDHFADPEIAALSRRIDVVGEDDRYVDGRVVSTVEVTLRDGRTLTSEVDKSAEHLPTIESMSSKLRMLAEGAWEPDRTERVIGLIIGDPATPLEELSGQLTEAP
jgi:2-methylcitrate dehydratase PrpD